MKNMGFTLMELLVVMGVMLVIIGAGMNIFYQSLRSGSRVDYELFVDTSSRVIESSMVSLIAYSRVVSVSGSDQDACLLAGEAGLEGDTLVVEVDETETEYSLVGDFIASSTAVPIGEVLINPEGIQVSDLNFNWVCLYGEPERVEVEFTAQAEKEDVSVPIVNDYSFEILLKNSGYY